MNERKTERLFRMYRALLRDGHFYRADCVDIDEGLTDANTRAFQRDVDAIKSFLSITLRREESARGPRYVIDESGPEDRTLDDLRDEVFRKDDVPQNECDLIHYFLKRTVERLDVLSSKNISPDILDAKAEEFDDFVHISLPSSPDYSYDSAQTDVILDAARELREITFEHFRHDVRKKRKHTVVPYGIFFRNGNWYLLANRDVQPKDAPDVRHFNLKRIVNVRVTEQKFLFASARVAKKQEAYRTYHTKWQGIAMTRAKENRNEFFKIVEDVTPIVMHVPFGFAHFFTHTDVGCNRRVVAEYEDKSVDVELAFTGFHEMWHFLLPRLGTFSFKTKHEFVTRFENDLSSIINAIHMQGHL